MSEGGSNKEILQVDFSADSCKSHDSAVTSGLIFLVTNFIFGKFLLNICLSTGKNIFSVQVIAGKMYQNPTEVKAKPDLLAISQIFLL